MLFCNTYIWKRQCIFWNICIQTTDPWSVKQQQWTLLHANNLFYKLKFTYIVVGFQFLEVHRQIVSRCEQRVKSRHPWHLPWDILLICVICCSSPPCHILSMIPKCQCHLSLDTIPGNQCGEQDLKGWTSKFLWGQIDQQRMDPYKVIYFIKN